MKISFVHTSDIHLGDMLYNPEMDINYSDKKRIDVWDTFDKIIELIKSNEIQFFFICGDLLNNKYFRYSDLKRLSEKFQEVRNTRIVILPGKYDSYYNMSCYNIFSFPDNVFVINKENKDNKLYFEEFGLYIHWLPDKKGSIEDYFKLLKINEIDSVQLNILLAYEEKDELLKSGFENISNNKFDYIAIGGSHMYKEISSVIIYSGSPEPLEFAEAGQHGIVLGRLSKKSFDKMFVPINKSRHIIKEILISPSYSFEKILDIISYSGDYISFSRDYYRIILIGEVSAEIDIDELKRKAAQYFKYVEFSDKYLFKIDYEKILEENSGCILEDFVKYELEKENKDLDYQKSFITGINTLLGEKVD